jgi:hypothetical protein
MGRDAGGKRTVQGTVHVLTYLKNLQTNSAFQVSPGGLLGGTEDGSFV